MKIVRLVFLCGLSLDALAEVPLQPLALQVRQLEDALAYLGQPLLPADQRRINDAIAGPDEAAAVARSKPRSTSAPWQWSRLTPKAA